MFIPSESVSAFCEEVMKMVDTKQKKGKVWDYSKKEEVEVDGIYINAKAKEGRYGRPCGFKRGWCFICKSVVRPMGVRIECLIETAHCINY